MCAITPNSKFYVATKCRWLLGVEHLALQSIFYENRIELMRYEDSLLKSLAGNAFEGAVVRLQYTRHAGRGVISEQLVELDQKRCMRLHFAAAISSCNASYDLFPRARSVSQYRVALVIPAPWGFNTFV